MTCLYSVVSVLTSVQICLQLIPQVYMTMHVQWLLRRVKGALSVFSMVAEH